MQKQTLFSHPLTFNCFFGCRVHKRILTIKITKTSLLPAVCLVLFHFIAKDEGLTQEPFSRAYLPRSNHLVKELRLLGWILFVHREGRSINFRGLPFPRHVPNLANR